MERTILHCDLNSFFASVELLTLPHLREVPVAVCGDPSSRHGIVLAKNEPAKAYGVKTAETIWQARKKCPDLVCIPPHHDRYALYSKLVNEIYLRYTDLVEPFGIDESWLDITGSMHLFGGDAAAIADEIRETVKKELGLTLSVGVSFNKIFAKLGSDYRKPDATTLIDRNNWQEIIFPLPVDTLLFVGHAAAKTMNSYGIHRIGELAHANAEMLETLFGKQGRQLHQFANGLGSDHVRPWHLPEPIKSVGNSITYPHNLTTRAEVCTAVSFLCDTVAMRLRKHALYCSGVQISIKDPQFKTVSRQKKLPHATHLMKELMGAAMELIEGAWKAPQPIRLLGVTAIHLTEAAASYEQVDLFGAQTQRQNEKQEKLEQAVDAIRAKYGTRSISFGAPGKLGGSPKE